MPSGTGCIKECYKGKNHIRENFPECEPDCKKFVKGWWSMGGKSRRVRRRNRKTRRR
jgi:hypothetical protein